jgi:hypothetical protein
MMPSLEGVEATFANVALQRFLELRELHWFMYLILAGKLVVNRSGRNLDLRWV